MTDNEDENIKVVVRVRDLIAREKEQTKVSPLVTRLKLS